MFLNELRDNDGATKNRMRVGRGIGSGKGKTGGRGVKGQKSRSGVSIAGFEGGQMPLFRRMPKFGFNNHSAKEYVEINLGRLQTAIDNEKLDITQIVDADALLKAGIISKKADGVRLLAKGNLTSKVNFEVKGCSEAAKAAVEAAGGSVTVAVKPAPLKTGKRVARRVEAAKKRELRQAKA